MTLIFLDSVGAIALINHADQWHGAAEAAYEHVKAANREFVTTSLVLFETGNAFARSRFRTQDFDVWKALSDRGRLVVPTNEECNEGWMAYCRSAPGAASIVDCISFVVMRRLGLTEAFTNDQHFTAAGFATLF